MYVSRKRLSKLAFKRVREARGAFRTVSERVSPHRRKLLEEKYRAQGFFDYKEQATLVRFQPRQTVPLAQATIYFRSGV